MILDKLDRRKLVQEIRGVVALLKNMGKQVLAVGREMRQEIIEAEPRFGIDGESEEWNESGAIQRKDRSQVVLPARVVARKICVEKRSGVRHFVKLSGELFCEKLESDF
jgi:hypothetical protein